MLCKGLGCLEIHSALELLLTLLQGTPLEACRRPHTDELPVLECSNTHVLSIIMITHALAATAAATA